MKRLFLAAAALMIVLPASAEALKTSRVIKEMKQACVAEMKAHKQPRSGPYCSCVSKAAKKWVGEAEDEKETQIRLWSLKNDLLPEDTTDEQLFARTSEAGIEDNEMTGALILNFYAIEDFYTDCAPKAE